MYTVHTNYVGARGGVASLQPRSVGVLLACIDHLCVLLLQASKAESAAAIHQLQDKEKMLAAVKEEAAVAKEQCKQLTQVNAKTFVCIESFWIIAGARRMSSNKFWPVEVSLN